MQGLRPELFEEGAVQGRADPLVPNFGVNVDAEFDRLGKSWMRAIWTARCAPEYAFTFGGHQQPIGANVGEYLEPRSPILDRRRLSVEGGDRVFDVVVVDGHQLGEITLMGRADDRRDRYL